MQEKNKFDFNNAMSNFTDIEKKKEDAKKQKRNTNIALVGVGVAVLAGVSYGVNSSIEANRAEIDAKLTAAKSSNTPVQDAIAWLEAKEKTMRANKNTQEQLMNSAIAQKRNTIVLLDAEREVSQIYKKLNDAHIEDAKQIQKLLVEMKAVDKAMTSSLNYDQKEDFLSSNSFKAWQEVTKLQKADKQLDDNINSVKNEFNMFMNEIVTFEKQYVKVIKEVIASGKYSLNQTQAEIMHSIQKESNETKIEFEEVQKEVKEAAAALASEGEAGGTLGNEFNESDLTAAKSAISDMENATLQKAMEDKKVVEDMIASINNGASVESALGMTGEAPAPTTTTTTTTSSSGSSMMPFLMGMWLGNAFGSSPSYNNYAGNSNVKDKEQRSTSGYAGASSSRTYAGANSSSNSSRLGSFVSTTSPTKSYSFRNQDSYINKAATNSSRALGSSSLKNAQAKLNNSKIAANRATSLKQAAFSKAGIAPNTRASQARMAISQQRAVAAQRATSVSSRGGMSSARGFSSGG